MASSDYIAWDDEDMNLDLLLGEYTDYEQENVDRPISKKQKLDKSDKSDSVTYICPVCSKVFKSVSGFRGHTIKKHSMNSMKGIFCSYIFHYDPHRCDLIRSLL